jgi:signal transduction histidine kinase
MAAQSAGPVVMSTLAAMQRAITPQDPSTTLSQSQDEERRRMARDLHDSTSQNLVAVLMNLATVQENASLDDRVRALLDHCAALVEQSSAEIRAICYDLYPPGLDELGLGPVLEHAAGKLARETGVPVKVDVPLNFGRYGRAVELALLRSMQDAFEYLRMQTRSQLVKISARGDEFGVSVSIHYCGPSDKEAMSPEDRGVIAKMQARMSQVGGVVEVVSDKRCRRITASVACSVRDEEIAQSA